MKKAIVNSYFTSSLIIFNIGIALMMTISCSRESTPSVVAVASPQLNTTTSAPFVLKATVFKMSGDYADNVAVTFNADGILSYFPAPTDISSLSAPLSLGDGWYLNRQGLGASSVFTKWTFDEYSRLDHVPSIEEIKSAVIPGARVTEFRTLPVNAAEARSMSPEEILQLL